MRIKYSWLGISSVLIYTAISILSLQFNWGEGYEDRPILHYLCLFSGAFVLYVIVVLQIVRNYPEAPNLWMILLFGLLFRAAIFPANQIQEDDVYRYLWDGKVFANGINPYKYSPTEISSAKRLKIGDPEKFKTHYNIKEQEELLRLYQLKWENDRSVIFMERINHPAVPTIYPPFTQVIFRIVNQISPDNIYTMRLVFLLFDLIVLAFVILILQTLGRNPRFCIIYFWSPLVIKETFNSTHLDIVGVGILCSSLYFLVHRWRVSAMAFLALGTMSKFYPAILLPVYLRESIRNRPKGESKVTTWLIVGVCLTVFFAICTVFYWPFRDAGIGVFTGLKKFTTFWQSNDSLFAILVLIYKNIIGLKQSFTLDQEAQLLSYDLPTLLAKLTSAGILFITTFLFSIRRGLFSSEQTLRHCFVVMALVFLLSPVQNPWYLIWIVPFLCVFPVRSWILLTGLTGLYYVDFYLDYQGITEYETFLIFVEYVPFYILLIYDYIKKKRELSVVPVR